jgi:hypothetical protein
MKRKEVKKKSGKKFKIPKKFNLFQKEIVVIFDEDLYNKCNSWGSANYENNTIMLQPSTPNWHINEEDLYQVFVHEVLHLCFDALSIKSDNEETMVDTLASLITQMLKTSKY